MPFADVVTAFDGEGEETPQGGHTESEAERPEVRRGDGIVKMPVGVGGQFGEEAGVNADEHLSRKLPASNCRLDFTSDPGDVARGTHGRSPPRPRTRRAPPTWPS